MSASHLIDNAVIDIAYGRGVGDSAHRSELESFVTTSLLSVMEEVFDAQLQHDEVLRIEQLELDLGEINFSDYHEQMPARLREKLLKALQGIKRRHPQRAGHSQSLLSRKDSDRELLHYFLRHGSLPWYRARCDIAELERILAQQLSDDSAGLQRFLRQAGANLSLYNRLVFQFGDTMRLHLIRAFSPTVAERLSHNMSVLHRHLASLSMRGEGGRQGHTLFYDRVWAALLKAVVDGGATALSADALFERVLKQELSASSEGLLHTIRAGSPTHPSGRAANSPISRLIHRLVSRQTDAATKVPYFVPDAPWLPRGAGVDSATAELYQLHRQLEAFLLGAVVDHGVWQKLFQHHPGILTEALRHYGKKQAVRHHLVVQLDDEHLHQLITLIEPTEHGFIHAVINESTSRKRHDEKANVDPQNRSDAWEFTLAYLFVERGSRFNKHSYLTSLLKQMANRRNLYLAQVLMQIREGLISLDIGSRFTAQILQTLTGIAQQLGIDEGEQTEDKLTQASADSFATEQQDATDQHLRQQLMAFLRGGSLSQLPWRTLYEEQGGMVTAMLRRYAQQREVRKHLVQMFSTEMLHQVVSLLQPSEQEFICTTVAQTVRYQHRVNSDWTEQAASEVVWEFTLAYLVVEQGSCFNRRSYLTSLLRQMAASRNMSAAQLLEQMRHIVQEGGGNNRFQLQLLEMLVELADELDIDAHDNATQKRLADAYVQYQLLAGLMQGERAGSLRAEQAQLRAVEQLQRHSPWLLTRLFAELQQDGAAYRQFSANANLALLRQLLESYLQLSNSPHHQSSGDFYRTISHHATMTPDARLFYSYVLDALLNDELIDFELFHSGMAAQPDSGHTVSADGPVTHNNGDASRTDSEISSVTQSASPQEPASQAVAQSEGAAEATATDEAKVVREMTHLLNAKRSLSDSEARQLAEHLDYLLGHYPQQAKRQLLAAIKERTTLERLVRSLPESMLGRLLPLINTSAQRLLQSAEILTAAAYANNLGLQRSDVQRIKWLGVYAYVAHIGSLFNPQEFVRIYLEEFTAQVGDSALKQVGRGLAEQLKRSAIPAAQSTVYQLLNGLSTVVPAMEADNVQRSATALDEEDAASQQEGPEVNVEEDIYIENAGLVLATPYLPMLFDRLGLTEERKFKDREAAELGIHMLQYLVTAEEESAEFQLVLNKLLCGVPPGQSIHRSITLTETQGEQLNSLLTAMIQHWTALGSTSIAGLRETFLNRPGTLRLQDDAWRLTVEERAFDVLLDRIPWSYSTIKYPWMKQVIYVEWR